MSLQNIEPKEIWKNFSLLNAVPRPSKKEEEVSAFMVAFGKQLNLETTVDKDLNVLIKKPATTGFENKKTVVIQSHLDMVHQKNNDTDFDFSTQGIEMYVDGDWVKAKGTTLGADNGLGVAAIMTILESDTIEHPAIEALFTIDEETGMTGAFALQPEFLSGDILLNLDTEDDDEITIGCAGGIDVTATKKYTQVAVNPNSKSFEITLKGLNGGHSGVQIHEGLGNANKLLNRVLCALSKEVEIELSTFQGGNLRNAIPREATAVISIASNQVEILEKQIAVLEQILQTENATKEPNLVLLLEATSLQKEALDPEDFRTLTSVIYSCLNGVYTWDQNIEGLVETSNNLAAIRLNEGTVSISTLLRSSVETSKYDLVNQLTATFSLGGLEVSLAGSYPGWQPKTDAEILQVLVSTYENMFQESPKVNAIHAGLECGIIGRHYPNMEMISFGPTIKGAHSPDERAGIKSTQKFWSYLVEILKNIPNK